MNTGIERYFERHGNQSLEATEVLKFIESISLDTLLENAERMALEGHGRTVTYSRKVFIPLTELCRDVCHYCTFSKPPRRTAGPYLLPEQVLVIARAGAEMGCKEALFTLGDKPELRFSVAREALADMGHRTTLGYLRAMAQLVFKESGLLPHLNPGVMTSEDLFSLRQVSVSMGIMLETNSARLSDRGGPHYGSPDKLPAQRIASIRSAGELQVPLTSGILIGIGETRLERIDALLALRSLHQEFGHLQEIIIQNFRAKPQTRMAAAPEPSIEDQVWTIAAARMIFGPEMSIQAPPNLRPSELPRLLRAGINDWGGVSPVTPDHVNPEAPWPTIESLRVSTQSVGRSLVERLALLPRYAMSASRWVAPTLRPAVLRFSTSLGFARPDGWFAGAESPLSTRGVEVINSKASIRRPSPEVAIIIARAQLGLELDEKEIVHLFSVNGPDQDAVIQAADRLRASVSGESISYVVNRNINYTNLCTHRCGFCAFSKGRRASGLREAGYNLDLQEIAARTAVAWQAGATEVCLQGGIHPDFTGQTYLQITAAVKEAAPDIHIHAFSPLEIRHGARTLGLSLTHFLTQLKAAGLSTLPGTAAEILDDEVRRVICPDKLNSQEWLDVMSAAHAVGLRTTATIMFGHADHPRHWARHLLRIRQQQGLSHGFTEFVPLPFVHMEAPIWRKGLVRSGPTFSEAVLMHAIARLVLHTAISNIQTSWVKMGMRGAARCLQAGANDLGGTLMNESITRAAGGINGQGVSRLAMSALATELGRASWQRSTLYQAVSQTTGRASVCDTTRHQETLCKA